MSLDTRHITKSMASVIVYAFCQGCGAEVKTCGGCEKRPAPASANETCRICVDSSTNPQHRAPIFFCKQCEQTRNLTDIYPEMSPSEPRARATCAFKEEMARSGNAVQALLLYSSFFRSTSLTGAELLKIVETQTA